MYDFIVELSNLLRKSGVRVGVSESLDACQAVNLLSNYDYETIMTGIKITMIKDYSKYSIFEKLFKEMLQALITANGNIGMGNISGQIMSKTATYGNAGQAENTSSSDKAGKNTIMYSPAEVLHKREVKPIDLTKIKTGKRIMKRLRRKFAILPGLRWKPSKKGNIDFVRTFRSSLNTFGEIIKIKKSERIKTRVHLVAFLDISGSMDSYNDWLVRAMYLFSRFDKRAEIFVFSTRLLRITDLLMTSSLDEIRRRLSQYIDLWGSGTRIGYSLKTFLDNYGSMIGKNWIAIIVSDGWDTGDIDLLRIGMENLRMRVSKIIWLNPHADRLNFRPLTIGMLTALPYIDVLAGTSVIEDYRAFLKFFGTYIKPDKYRSSRMRYA
ncbi:MAG: VWA domain-containing protein [Nitrososphaerota archaeon]